MTIEHNLLGNNDTKSHGILWKTVANAAALAALNIAADDVAQRKVVLQSDTGQLWVPITTGLGASFLNLLTSLSALNGQQLIKHNNVIEAIGSLSADVTNAGATRTPSTDKVCTFWLADAVAVAAPTLTLNNSTIAVLAVSVIVAASTGVGRWVVKSQDGSTAWTQPDNGAWLVDFQWSAGSSAWVVSAAKPNQ